MVPENINTPCPPWFFFLVCTPYPYGNSKLRAPYFSLWPSVGEVYIFSGTAPWIWSHWSILVNTITTEFGFVRMQEADPLFIYWNLNTFELFIAPLETVTPKLSFWFNSTSVTTPFCGQMNQWPNYSCDSICCIVLEI